MNSEQTPKPTALLFYLHRAVVVVWWLTVLHCIWTLGVYVVVRPAHDTVVLPFQINVGISPDEHFPADFITVNGTPLKWERYRGYGHVAVSKSSVSPGVAYTMDLVRLLGIAAYLAAFWRIKRLLDNAVTGRFFIIENAINMRWLGWCLLIPVAAGSFSEIGLRYAGFAISNGTMVDLLGWFPGIGVLVMGEVFLAGAKLEHDRSLTV